jgi:23S rRNA (uracil-5-)-methyltransferase RumA
MKYGEIKKFEVTHVDRKGRGRGLVNDRPACADFVVPGETVEGKFVGRKKGVKKFEIDQIENPSPHRVEAACAHAGDCGGCAWQHIAYDHQLELKRDLINQSFERGGLTERVAAVIPCPQQYRYRNRMDYCVGDRGEVGLKKRGRWNQYVDLQDCRLVSELAVKALLEFKGWLRDNEIEPWNAFRHTGYARYLVIREGKNTGERMLTVVTSDGELPARDDLLRRFKPLATTIYHGINPEITDLSLAPQLELLHGEPELTEQIAGRRYRIPPNSFFQTNSLMAEQLLETVREHVLGAKAEKLLDLYCGVGFFAIGLSDAAKEIYGVELDEAAIVAARRNAELNELQNVRFDSAKAESLIWEQFAPDTVIIDPPRAGLHPKVVETLAERRPPTLIYVSCNYESFVRDWQGLQDHYRIADCRALDLFPNSPHVELVLKLELK